MTRRALEMQRASSRKRSAPCQANKAITPNKKSLPKGCSAKAVARE
jgi:hypothetical protein